MRFSHLLLLLFFCGAVTAQPCREVVAFFPSWKWYDRGRLVNPETIDYSLYTIINYSFFRPNEDGSISIFDPLADKTLLLGKFAANAKRGYKKNKEVKRHWHISGTSLVDKAHEHGVKVLISIGGWTMSDNFSSIAASSTKRRRFAQSCVDLIHTYGIDGVDIDWEYPGNKAQNGGARDKANFTLLLREIRDAFNTLEWEAGKKLLLTADFGAGKTHLEQIEWEAVIPLLDQINIMTYDFYGSRPSRTNHHSPLYAPRKGVEGYDLDSSVKYLMEHHFVPAHKINIGLAFFGRSLKTKGKAKIHTVSYRKTDAKTFPEDKGAPAYYNILARQHHFKYHWDNYAEVPYLTGKKLRTFVTFDDEASIQKKGRYILENGLGGAIVWDLMSDYVESKHRSGVIASTPLASALKGSLCQEVYVQRPTATKLVQRTIVSIERLPQHWPSLAYQSFAPRLAIQPVLSKKEQKKKKRRERKRRKKQGVNHFDRV